MTGCLYDVLGVCVAVRLSTCVDLLCAQFKEHFIRRGAEGGQKAAQALKAAILKQCHGLATEIEVIAKVYVNLAGLAQAMMRDGSLDGEGDLKDFSLGFTQRIASFDFIDIGSGRAATKIKGTERGGLEYLSITSRQFRDVNLRLTQTQPHGTLEITTANTSYSASPMTPRVAPLSTG